MTERPKRPLNTYFRFVKNNFEKINDEMGHPTPQKVMSELAALYRDMPQKLLREYQREFEEEMAEYEKLKEKYDITMGTPKKRVQKDKIKVMKMLKQLIAGEKEEAVQVKNQGKKPNQAINQHLNV